MNWWTNNLFALFIAVFAGSLWALPPGLARITSVYTDREDDRAVLMTGYGLVIELNFKFPDGSKKSQFVVQTVSHVSQGGYESGHASATSPDGRPKPVPKLLVELYFNQNTKVFAHHSWTSLEPEFANIVGSAKVHPLIMSSYFESFRDLDLLILDSSKLPQDMPVAMSLSFDVDDAGATISVPELSLRELDLTKDWHWFRVSDKLAIPCPKTFSSCGRPRSIQASGPVTSALSQRIINDEFVAGEYEFWINFSSEPGMSGLPVYSTDATGAVLGVLGLISGTDAHTGDTWLSQIIPKKLFDRWAESVQLFLQSNEIYKVYGLKDFIWMLSDGQLSRVGESQTGIRYQESRVHDKSGSPKRCNRGSGFRMDNGSGFRFDTGDSNCSSEFERGNTFVTQKPGERPYSTAFMVMDHPDLTLFLPPTATGMGYYFLQSDLDAVQIDLGLAAEKSMKFKIFSQAPNPAVGISAEEFARFAQTIYEPTQDSWQASLVATVIDTSSSNPVLSESKSHITLKPRFDKANRLLSISIRLDLEDGKALHHIVNYTDWNAVNSIANMYQKVKLANVESILSLEGLLMHNPDLLNIPDLDLTMRADLPMSANTFEFHRSIGDPDLKTIFTLRSGSRVYYFGVVR